MDSSDMLQLLVQRLSAPRARKTIGPTKTVQTFDPNLAYGQLQAVLGQNMPLSSFPQSDVSHAFGLLQSEGADSALQYMRGVRRFRQPGQP
jgi:hypothetical protein